MKAHIRCKNHGLRPRWHSVHAAMHCAAGEPPCHLGGLRCALDKLRRAYEANVARVRGARP